MLPILLSLGPVKIYAFGVFLVLGLFLGLYFWWKMGRDEHWDEIELFDAYFLTLLVYLLSSRLLYVLTHPAVQTWYRAMAVLAYPGMLWGGGLAIAAIFLVMFARSHDWDSWKVVDAAAVAVLAVIVFVAVGAILNGSNPGREAVWGLVFLGDSVRRIPVDLWTLVWGLISFGAVSRIRKQFRFYAWYKGDSSVAHDGLAALTCFVFGGIYWVLAGYLDEGTVWQVVMGGGMVVAGLIGIYMRSGRRDKLSLLQWLRQKRLKV